MMLAPEPYLSACLEVLTRAALFARALGWSGEDGLSARQSQQITELMDTIHNIPKLIQHWETCDESLLRKFLADYDTIWSIERRTTRTGDDRVCPSTRHRPTRFHGEPGREVISHLRDLLDATVRM